MPLEDKNLILEDKIMGVRIKIKGSFKNTEKYLKSHQDSAFTEQQIYQIADYALELFKKNTPTSSGKTANSWSYEIVKKNGKYSIFMHNSNIQNGYNIAILVNDGHATSDGHYISGTYYIDQTIKEISKYIDTLK